VLPLVAVSNRGQVPPTLRGCRDGRALVAVPAAAPGLEAARRELGDENVIVCGEDRVEIGTLLDALHERGWLQVLTEGGPTLLAAFLAEGRVDELCFTIAPHVVGGEHPRTVAPAGTPAELHLELLVEQDDTLMGRWLVRR
jgi:riboflavin biosynthesis pyrimidine reductase